ncbi:MAG: hypothetical protein PHF74_07925 [Dehalococcoidales bacterium]|nr:hypothetical protein [Dehalococcoidales bacterium]
MKDLFINYLDDIETPSIINSRINRILSLNNFMTDEEVVDIFICDELVNDNIHEYTNLWLFTESFALEAKNFQKTIDLDITPIKDSIDYWKITTEDTNLSFVKDNSTLTLEFASQGISGRLKATGRNCKYLKKIIESYFRKNVFF